MGFYRVWSLRSQSVLLEDHDGACVELKGLRFEGVCGGLGLNNSFAG